MIGLIICVLLLAFPVGVMLRSREETTVIEMLFVLGIAGIVVLLIGQPLIAVTGGLYRGYSEGYREGFITKMSNRGVIFKTYEGEMQLGAGEQSSLQEPFKFSVSDPDMAEFVEGYLGERVRVKYIQWLIQPYQEGESGYDIVEIVPVSD
jgi:hypothetical protein